MNQLCGKVALVTGGNAGIGKETAHLFAREGAKVVVAARREAEGEQVVSDIRSAGGEAIFVRTDVTRAEDCANAVELAVQTFGKIDVAFNNAGVLAFGKTVAEVDEAEWDHVLDVNLKGVFLSMKYVIPAMLKAGGGSIINMSSVGGLVGSPLGIAAYHASKHGVLGLTKAAALEYAPQKIRVNAVCPGASTSEMTDTWFAGSSLREAFIERHPLGRLGEPGDSARATLFLASDASSFITGAALPVDGGYSVG
ncbi:3-oxoacyl-[acyl-carrier protein] reductase [Caballeronia glathei]|uniref:Short-chain dehydrogenase n=1 Tax=Caballeronia glathei TaxID=60547 RepID=A0A069PV85_9BURK|nr:SDR family oxidoreductase [Caballeronia glathei]KDR43739.1 short-chain dehydrogenase [Caballeronia glathei]CDY75647.1 3-oxoacyl-[acyl-carrier protein] reductase [Caballeronia glathei]